STRPGTASAAPLLPRRNRYYLAEGQAVAAARACATSYSVIPAATPALSDSTDDAMGIDATASQVSRTRRESPLPSEPTTITSGSVAKARSRISVSPPASSPTTNRPAFFRSVSVRARLVSFATGTRAAAPAETFQADAVTEAERREGTTTPCAPNAPADRSTAPRLRGSVTESSATMSGGSPASAAASSRSSTSLYSYGGTSSATPWCTEPSVSWSSAPRDDSSSR